jgi:ABC-2 type transport system ATP-binding protein
MSQNDEAIRIEDLTIRFQDLTAVDGLNLTVGKGELFGLLGPNGAGKTTIINVLCGLLRPTGGNVEVGGHDVRREMDKVKGMIGVCPQEMGIFPFLTGRENVELFGDLMGVPKGELKARVDGLMDKMSLSDDIGRKVKDYSGGMKRRISLIMALVGEPAISFMDEPTTGMDPQSRRAVWDFIRGLKEKGMTIILTTHYMDEAEYLCDRVGIIDHGRIIALDPPKALMEKYKAKDLEEVFLRLTGKKIREAA